MWVKRGSIEKTVRKSSDVVVMRGCYPDTEIGAHPFAAFVVEVWMRGGAILQVCSRINTAKYSCKKEASLYFAHYTFTSKKWPPPFWCTWCHCPSKYWVSFASRSVWQKLLGAFLALRATSDLDLDPISTRNMWLNAKLIFIGSRCPWGPIYRLPLPDITSAWCSFAI